MVIGRSIAIHIHMAQIKEAVGWDNMRYKEPYVGGQFGIKASVTSEAVTAAAALHFRRPIRYSSKHERIDAHHLKRHPYHAQVEACG